MPALLLGLIGVAALLTSETGTVSARRFLADPMSVLAERSPGARGPGALTQTKLARVLPTGRRRPFVPTERVLPTIRERPGIAGEPGGLGPLEVYPQAAQSPLGGVVPGGPGGPGLAPLGNSVGSLPPTNFLGGTNTGNGPTVPGNGGTPPVTTPGDGTGPTVPGNGGNNPAPPVNSGPGGGIVPAIPEPATWLMMAIGMAAIGWTLRRGRSPHRAYGNAADVGQTPQLK